MSILHELSSAKGQRNNEANFVLVNKIVETENKNAVIELVNNLNNQNTKLQGDCIKVLYEVAYINPALISDHCKAFLDQLGSKNNRMVWGSMAALMAIAELKHKEIVDELELIYQTIENGSVITIDCGVGILGKLNKYPQYSSLVEPKLIKQLWKCPIKQLAQYIDRVMDSIHQSNREIYINIINERMPECEKVSQEKRLKRSLKTIKSKPL